MKRLGVLKGKLVTSFRGNDITQFLAAHPGYYDELFREGDIFLPVSKSLKAHLEAAGCPANRIHVLHSGIDCSRFSFSERSHSPGETTRLLGIGRLVPKKGWGDAIDAVENALKMGRKIHFAIAGDGPLRQVLERAIADKGIQDAVTLLGWRDHDEITQLLNQSHLLIAPSVTTAEGDQEGIPNVLKEAMAMGLPVLSTWHSGIPELVEDGVTGYLVSERDVAGMTHRLNHLCDHPEQWAEMGRKARLKIEEEFDMEKLNDELAKIYSSIAK
jgi:colanic acid/amylovoran biosynthesis glycosyltransferase